MESLSIKKEMVAKKYTVDVDGISINVPAIYGDVSATMCFLPIDCKSAKSLILDEHIFPVKIFPNVGVLGITVFDYKNSPVGPYREIAFSIPSTFGRSLPIFPLLFDSAFKNFGFYTLLLAMNTDLGIKHSEKVYGYPVYNRKIMIDINDSETSVNIDAHEDGLQILSMTMKKFKRYNLMKNKLYRTYFNTERGLCKVDMTVDAVFAERNFGCGFRYAFGGHKISEKYVNHILLRGKPLKYMHYSKAIEILSEPYIV